MWTRTRMPNFILLQLQVLEGQFLGWDKIKLPPLLPIHGVRVKNRMPQLAVILDAESIKSTTGTTLTFAEDGEIPGADELATKKYKQMYEPTTFHAIETGVMDETSFNCFITAPEKGLKLYKITYSDKTTKTIAVMPMLGPYGNEARFDCYPKNIKDAYLNVAFGTGTTQLDALEVGTNQGTPSIGYLMSFQPGGGGYTTWDDDHIDRFHDAAKNKENNVGNYINGHARLYHVYDTFSPKGLECLVVGSAPAAWVEGVLLSYDPKHITTSEYQVPAIPADSKYASRMSTIHHEELLANPVQFDMITIFSSIEHDGLGRYHDPMSPGGDLQQMKNIFELLKPGGILVLEVPLKDPDHVQFPGGREYGTIRYPYLVEKFILEGMYNIEKTICKGTEAIGGCNKVETLKERFRMVKAGEAETEHAVSVLRKPKV